MKIYNKKDKIVTYGILVSWGGYSIWERGRLCEGAREKIEIKIPYKFSKIKKSYYSHYFLLLN
ncbi:MAG: hypothetical protein U9P79_00325 [Candidatus Cloacimonadota bacterium]|nr:hypothetical protein [Candidatus Cloacimonadota bacterium]